MKQPLRLCTKHQLKWVFESVRLVIVFEVIIEPPLFVVLVISYLPKIRKQSQWQSQLQ